MSSTLGTALVTGASSGIGATYARKLAERGHDLLLVARDEERLAALAAELKGAHGIAADILKADLTLPADVKRVEERLRADQAISVLVNNAGIGPNGVLLDGDIDYLDRMIAINVTAANRLAVAAAQAFAQRGRGTIINIASVVALAPEIFNETYSASKAFILALTQSLAHELRETPVRIQAVLPGLTRTEIFDRVGSSFDHIDPERVMGVEDLVRSAVVGLDQGELVT
ncbi:MAG: SDR family NAD(P)-dependent oxidoreductase, partial [Alphaproteobacteria bacterium]|nr:SDR family NAD(P)-dependent oxidoreductase [Alphaproteobacteria bacterium]